MLERKIKFKDVYGNQREGTYYFDLNKAEVTQLNYSYKGGFAEFVKKSARHEDGHAMTKLFEKLILESYGEPSEDGIRFIKSPEATKAFKESNAYSELYMELMRDATKFADFMNAILPADMNEMVDEEVVVVEG